MKHKILFAIAFATSTLNCQAGGGLNLTLKNKLFVFAGGGGSKLDVDTSLASNSILIPGALDNSGKNIEIGVGFKHSKNIFTTLTFQKNKLSIADVNNVYGSINYQFSTLKVKPFIGALIGRSRLKWSERPHQVLINENLTSKSFMYGVQFGIEKELQKRFSVFAKYQFIKYDHEIEIVNNTSNIKHNSGQNLLLGLRYSF